MISKNLVGEILMSYDPFDKFTICDLDSNSSFSASGDFILHCGLPCVEKYINYVCIDVIETDFFIQIYCVKRKG